MRILNVSHKLGTERVCDKLIANQQILVHLSSDPPHCISKQIHHAINQSTIWIFSFITISSTFHSNTKWFNLLRYCEKGWKRRSKEILQKKGKGKSGQEERRDWETDLVKEASKVHPFAAAMPFSDSSDSAGRNSSCRYARRRRSCSPICKYASANSFCDYGLNHVL